MPIVDPDEVELKADLEVRREMVGPVIGRQGQTVTQIRKDTGAQIHIRDSVPGETDQIIEVKGTRSQVMCQISCNASFALAEDSTTVSFIVIQKDVSGEKHKEHTIVQYL